MALTLLAHALASADMVPHIETLTRLARGKKHVVELGVRTGVSTWALLDGGPATLTSVDTDPTVLGIIPERVREDPHWRLVIADDRWPTTRALLPPRADLVFIDTSHEYDHTTYELALAAALGAHVIVLHDWNLPGVRDAAEHDVLRRGGRIEIEKSEWGLGIVYR